jgi:hypothetical protein
MPLPPVLSWPDQCRVKLRVVVTAGSCATLLEGGRASTRVLACGLLGVAWTMPVPSVATL